MTYYHVLVVAIANNEKKTAIFAFFGLLSALTLLIYSFEIVSILRNKMHIMRRIRTVMLLSLYPVSCDSAQHEVFG